MPIELPADIAVMLEIIKTVALKVRAGEVRAIAVAALSADSEDVITGVHLAQGTSGLTMNGAIRELHKRVDEDWLNSAERAKVVKLDS